MQEIAPFPLDVVEVLIKYSIVKEVINLLIFIKRNGSLHFFNFVKYITLKKMIKIFSYSTLNLEYEETGTMIKNLKKKVKLFPFRKKCLLHF